MILSTSIPHMTKRDSGMPPSLGHETTGFWQAPLLSPARGELLTVA